MDYINWISVAIAALATFVIGGFWYSPLLFLKPWQKDMNIDASQPGHPARVFSLAYIFSFLSCALLATLLGPDANLVAGLKLGTAVGLFIVFCSFGINYQFANRPLRALFIDGGYPVVQFALFGLVLGAWPG